MTKGDPIIVVMTRNDVFPWQVGPTFPATFYYASQGAGDTYKVAVESIGDVYLNANSSDFVGIYLDEEKYRTNRIKRNARVAEEAKRLAVEAGQPEENYNKFYKEADNIVGDID